MYNILSDVKGISLLYLLVMSSWGGSRSFPSKKTASKGYTFTTTPAGFCSLFNNYFYAWLFAKHRSQPLLVFDKQSPLGLNTPILKTTFQPPQGVEFLSEPPATPLPIPRNEQTFFLSSQTLPVLRAQARPFFTLLPLVADDITKIIQTASHGTSFDIGVHMRAGDKITTKEMPTIPVRKYIEAVAAFAKSTTNLRIFLMSDTKALIQEFRANAPANWQIITLPFNTVPTHTQYDFNTQPSHVRETAYLHFLAELECMRRCSKIVCTFSSNVSRFLYLTTPETTAFRSLDVPEFSCF